jgi:hypothetical protein
MTRDEREAALLLIAEANEGRDYTRCTPRLKHRLADALYSALYSAIYSAGPEMRLSVPPWTVTND